MPTFKQGDVIKVPFPYTDRATRKSRPALVVSSGTLEELHGLLWVVMITSAQNSAWPKDITVSKLKQAGLPSPSVIRSVKIATIEAVDASKIGSIRYFRNRSFRRHMIWVSCTSAIWKAHGHRSANTLLTIERNRAAVKLDDAFRDDKSQAGSRFRLSSRV